MADYPNNNENRENKVGEALQELGSAVRRGGRRRPPERADGDDSNSMFLPSAAEEAEPITAGSVVQQGAALVGGSVGARQGSRLGGAVAGGLGSYAGAHAGHRLGSDAGNALGNRAAPVVDNALGRGGDAGGGLRDDIGDATRGLGQDAGDAIRDRADSLADNMERFGLDEQADRVREFGDNLAENAEGIGDRAGSRIDNDTAPLAEDDLPGTEGEGGFSENSAEPKIGRYDSGVPNADTKSINAAKTLEEGAGNAADGAENALGEGAGVVAETAGEQAVDAVSSAVAGAAAPVIAILQVGKAAGSKSVIPMVMALVMCFNIFFPSDTIARHEPAPFRPDVDCFDEWYGQYQALFGLNNSNLNDGRAAMRGENDIVNRLKEIYAYQTGFGFDSSVSWSEGGAALPTYFERRTGGAGPSIAHNYFDESTYNLMENILRIRTFFRAYGLTDVQIAVMIGNSFGESGVDPTTIETVGLNRSMSYRGIAPMYRNLHRDGQFTEISQSWGVSEVNFEPSLMGGVPNMSWANGYFNTYSTIERPGIGIMQFTDAGGATKHTDLRRYALRVDYEIKRIDLLMRLGYRFIREMEDEALERQRHVFGSDPLAHCYRHCLDWDEHQRSLVDPITRQPTANTHSPDCVRSARDDNCPLCIGSAAGGRVDWRSNTPVGRANNSRLGADNTVDNFYMHPPFSSIGSNRPPRPDEGINSISPENITDDTTVPIVNGVRAPRSSAAATAVANANSPSRLTGQPTQFTERWELENLHLVELLTRYNCRTDSTCGDWYVYGWLDDYPCCCYNTSSSPVQVGNMIYSSVGYHMTFSHYENSTLNEELGEEFPITGYRVVGFHPLAEDMVVENRLVENALGVLEWQPRHIPQIDFDTIVRFDELTPRDGSSLSSFDYIGYHAAAEGAMLTHEGERTDGSENDFEFDWSSFSFVSGVSPGDITGARNANGDILIRGTFNNGDGIISLTESDFTSFAYQPPTSPGPPVHWGEIDGNVLRLAVDWDNPEMGNAQMVYGEPLPGPAVYVRDLNRPIWAWELPVNSDLVSAEQTWTSANPRPNNYDDLAPRYFLTAPNTAVSPGNAPPIQRDVSIGLSSLVWLRRTETNDLPPSTNPRTGGASWQASTYLMPITATTLSINCSCRMPGMTSSTHFVEPPTTEQGDTLTAVPSGVRTSYTQYTVASGIHCDCGGCCTSFHNNRQTQLSIAVDRYNAAAEANAIAQDAFVRARLDANRAARLDIEDYIRDMLLRSAVEHAAETPWYSEFGLYWWDEAFENAYMNMWLSEEFTYFFGGHTQGSGRNLFRPLVESLTDYNRQYFELWEIYARGRYPDNMPPNGNFVNWWDLDIQMMFMVDECQAAHLLRNWDASAIPSYNIDLATQWYMREYLGLRNYDPSLVKRTEFAYAVYFLFQYGTDYWRNLMHVSHEDELLLVLDGIENAVWWKSTWVPDDADGNTPLGNPVTWSSMLGAGRADTLLSTIDSARNYSAVNAFGMVTNRCGYIDVPDNSSIATSAMQLANPNYYTAVNYRNSEEMTFPSNQSPTLFYEAVFRELWLSEPESNAAWWTNNRYIMNANSWHIALNDPYWEEHGPNGRRERPNTWMPNSQQGHPSGWQGDVSMGMPTRTPWESAMCPFCGLVNKSHSDKHDCVRNRYQLLWGEGVHVSYMNPRSTDSSLPFMTNDLSLSEHYHDAFPTPHTGAGGDQQARGGLLQSDTWFLATLTAWSGSDRYLYDENIGIRFNERVNLSRNGRITAEDSQIAIDRFGVARATELGLAPSSAFMFNQIALYGFLQYGDTRAPTPNFGGQIVAGEPWRAVSAGSPNMRNDTPDALRWNTDWYGNRRNLISHQPVFKFSDLNFLGPEVSGNLNNVLNPGAIAENTANSRDRLFHYLRVAEATEHDDRCVEASCRGCATPLGDNERYVRYQGVGYHEIMCLNNDSRTTTVCNPSLRNCPHCHIRNGNQRVRTNRQSLMPATEWEDPLVVERVSRNSFMHPGNSDADATMYRWAEINMGDWSTAEHEPIDWESEFRNEDNWDENANEHRQPGDIGPPIEAHDNVPSLSREVMSLPRLNAVLRPGDIILTDNRLVDGRLRPNAEFIVWVGDRMVEAAFPQFADIVGQPGVFIGTDNGRTGPCVRTIESFWETLRCDITGNFNPNTVTVFRNVRPEGDRRYASAGHYMAEVTQAMRIDLYLHRRRNNEV